MVGAVAAEAIFIPSARALRAKLRVSVSKEGIWTRCDVA